MQSRTEKFGAQQPLSAPTSSSQQRLCRKTTTYLAKIAVVLQDAPGKMLTFRQLMDKLAPLICEERKSVQNNIRVCLSSNNCFVKIPVVQNSLDSKRNYWKLDSSQLTPKMVRRHFKGILQLFPELASKVKEEDQSISSELSSPLLPPEAASCRGVQIRCEVKFSGPFSIESLLKRDSPSARPSSSSPLAEVPVRVEERGGTKRSLSMASEKLPHLQSSTRSYLMCSAGGSSHHGLGKASKRPQMYSEPLFNVHTGGSSYYSNTHSSYITYSGPSLSNDALRFFL